MTRFLRFFLAFLLVSILFGVFIRNQFNQGTTLFGPETFVREKGQPNIETWQFSTGCFEGPFLFHLRNGDDKGKNRVSSAHVWLDGMLLFGPSNFSQKVTGYDIFVDLKPQSVLQVKLDSASDSKLRIWIEGTPKDLFQYENITIFPYGGHYRLSNGIEMEVPDGAVGAPITVTLRRITKEEVDPIVQSYGIAPKYFLAGYQGEPHEFLFNLPITLRMPSEPLRNSKDLPFRFSLDRLNGAYCFSTHGRTDILSSFDSNAFNEVQSPTMRIQSAPEVSLAATDDCGKTLSPDTTRVLYNEDGWFIEASTQGLSGDEIDYALIQIQDPDYECNYLTMPCTCFDVYIYEEAKTNQASTVDGFECVVTGVSGSTAFCACPGNPTFKWEVKEEHKPIIEYRPDKVEVNIGESSDIISWDVVDAEGKTIRGVNATPTIENEEIADFITAAAHTGYVKGKRCGSTRLKLSTLCNETKYVDITVTLKDGDIVIEADETEVETCGTLELRGKVFDGNGTEIVNHPVEWISGDPSLATVSPHKGTATTLTALDKAGPVDITARACAKEKKITIRIKQKVRFFEISEHKPKIEVGEKLVFEAVAKDKCENPIENPTIDWQSSDPSIATVNPTNGEVEGISAGIVTIAATCGDFTDQTQMEVERKDFKIAPEIIEIYVGDTFQLTATFNDNPVQGSLIVWTHPQEVIISFDPDSMSGTGVAKGDNATIIGAYQGKTSSVTINVSERPIESIRIDPAQATITVGQNLQLNVYDQENNVVPKDLISWTIPEEEVTTFDPVTYVVTGVAFGDTQLTATCEGNSATIKIRVAEVASVEIEPQNPEVSIDETVQLKAIVKDNEGNVIDALTYWLTSSKSIATVGLNTGLVKGISKGQATITAISGGRSSTVSVRVSSYTVWRLTWNATHSGSVYYFSPPTESEGAWSEWFSGIADIKYVDYGSGGYRYEFVSFWADGNGQGYGTLHDEQWCEPSGAVTYDESGHVSWKPPTQQEIMSHLYITARDPAALGVAPNPFMFGFSYLCPNVTPTTTATQVGVRNCDEGYLNRTVTLIWPMHYWNFGDWTTWYSGGQYLNPDDESLSSFSIIATADYAMRMEQRGGLHYPGAISWEVKLVKIK